MKKMKEGQSRNKCVCVCVRACANASLYVNLVNLFKSSQKKESFYMHCILKPIFSPSCGVS